jgi:thiol-disulfide isomerase/thioredoxin
VGVLLCACDEKAEGPAPERFASVKKKAAATGATFCDKSWAAGEKKYRAPPVVGPKVATQGWQWLNLWATWCGPCVGEMALLQQWREAFGREQLAVGFELMSIDEPDADLESWRKKNLPGAITRFRTQDELAAFLGWLTLDKSAAIPIHVLVDPAGWVRCVRVGSIHEENWGAVRGLVSGG